ncbi:MAG: NAD(P)/FAD-dependent oxidoreductase [Clostridia bacterium]|nr:NAD(P)/FAD-dependent oxidoreductase [Clostridia bacterium]
MFDVVVIGAGVVGCAIARELSKYDIEVVVVDKEDDVCCGTSKANSAIIHAGFDAAHGSLMAEMNVRGSEMMEQLSKDLDFSYDRCGSLVVCLSEDDLPRLQALYENGVANGVKGLEIIDRARLKEMEPNVSDEAVAALWAPTGAIVCPFEMTLAFAEVAALNGAKFLMNAEVMDISYERGAYTVYTPRGCLMAGAVVNAAGVNADLISRKAARTEYKITPRRGDYYLLDHTAQGFVKHTVFQLPGKFGKGVLVTPTVHGNILVGPTAIDVDNREGTNTTAAGLAEVAKKAGLSVKNLPLRQTITSFAGLRAHERGHEFIIEESRPGFIDCVGIESPGLSSAPAIAERAAALLQARFEWDEKPHYIKTRKGILDPKKLTEEEWNQLILEKPAYGQIICRCESVTEGQILDAIHRPVPAYSIDAIKRRVRAGMGRCQGGFCSPRVMEILAREWHMPLWEVGKSGPFATLITDATKDAYRETPLMPKQETEAEWLKGLSGDEPRSEESLEAQRTYVRMHNRYLDGKLPFEEWEAFRLEAEKEGLKVRVKEAIRGALEEIQNGAPQAETLREWTVYLPAEAAEEVKTAVEEALRKAEQEVPHEEA